MKFSNQAKIGLMVVVVLAILAVFTLKSGNFRLGKTGYNILVHFKNVDGIKENAPVMLNGLEVGVVKEMKINYGETETLMELVLEIDQEAKLRGGAKAYVKNLGFMGEKYVGLTTGEPGQEYLSAGAVIVGTEPADFDKLVADGQVIAAQLKEVSININERLNKNKENIDAIMTNLNSITTNFDERLRVNKEHIDGILANLHSSTVNFDQFTYDLKLHPWKLLYRSKEERMKNRQTPDTQAPATP